jgi:hypothetical protein
VIHRVGTLELHYKDGGYILGWPNDTRYVYDQEGLIRWALFAKRYKPGVRLGDMARLILGDFTEEEVAMAILECL